MEKLYYIKVPLKQIGPKIVVWVHMAQDRDQWWALLEVVMNVRLA